MRSGKEKYQHTGSNRGPSEFVFFLHSPPVPPRLQDLVEATHMPQKTNPRDSTAHSVPGGIPGVGFLGAYVWPQPNAHNPGGGGCGFVFGGWFWGVCL